MPWKTDDIKRLVELEAHLRGIDPRLALALAEQESGFDPKARSPKGATGIFQLMPATARQLKVDPYDVAQNISGGLDYLKQQLDAFGGDPGMAVAAYNAGPGVVKAYGKVPPYKETRGLVSRVLGKLGPASAEASTPAPRSRLEEIEAELARRDAQQAPQATASTAQPQTAGMSRLQELEAHLARLEGRAAPHVAPTGTQTPPEPSPDPSATTGMRFQALPSITQLDPTDRIQKTRDFERLKPEMQEEFLRSEEPATGGLAMGGGPVAQSQPVTDPAALLALGKRAPGWREGDPLPPGARRPPMPTEAPVTEGITAPSTMIPLVMGTGIPFLTTAAPGMAAVQRLLPQAGPLITRGARAAGEGLSQTLGWTAGRTAETGQVPSPGEIGTEAALNVGTGGVIEGLGAARRGLIRRSQGGRAVQQEGQAVIPEAYSQAVEGQRQAIQTARAVPGRYKPETPSWTLYERFNDVAKHQDVDLLTAKTALADVRAGRGVLPDGSLRPFPQSVERIAASLEQAAETANVQTIQQELRRLGPLIRHADGNIRGPAKQLYGIYADALESSPAANDLLRNANATFRKEMALQDVEEWLRPGHGVIRIDNQGREVINPGQLMTRLEKKLGDDTLFARSFSPEELQSLRADIGRTAGTPSMPRTGPPTPQTAREVIGERPKLARKGAMEGLGGLEFLATSMGVPLGVVSGVKATSALYKQARYGLAYALTSERLRPLVLRAIQDNGTINPRVYGLIIAAMTPAEKKALERQTKTQER
jgi:hypothetical protein